MREFLAVAGKSVEEAEKKYDAIKTTYSKTCEYFLIDKSDDKYSSSMEFFKFFTQFIEQVIKNMPKEEKKRAAPGAGLRKVG